MADRDSLGERGRALEDDYFRKKDRELVEKMRRAAEQQQSIEQLGAATALKDPELLRELQELGFTPETVGLLPLVPMLQMAWAEGGVTSEERKALVDLARARGIAQGSAADAQLTNWLTTRPGDAVFERAGRLIRALLDSGAPSTSGLTAEALVQQAERIAAASGGIFGIGSISSEEKTLLSQIAADLQARGK